ncbi:hypothetical protein DPX16_10082 [Anabarilius grahami]|uniref:Uncharacterized protein n=1 Tax=Anabarilius grahami TaxID=495550 RepID=A0A3N0XY72_ANAGA|nr:hypothetical protein DPX16_10082 [Anabarilius grahami]
MGLFKCELSRIDLCTAEEMPLFGNEWDLHNLLRRCVRPGLIEFHLSVLLINNAVDVTGLYHVLRIGDDVCVSGDSGGRWHYAANGPCSNEVVTERDSLHEQIITGQPHDPAEVA